jgi:RNA-directed DNA polymerase
MRVVDGSVLRLRRSWLEAAVVEQAEDGTSQVSRPRQGTPQGGVISPLLANRYLHGFDKRFQAPGGPAQRFRARLVRYADDFVILARRQVPGLKEAVESLLEGWLGLTSNRAKTRVVNLGDDGASLDFLGYTFRYDRDRFGGAHRYLNLGPSAKSLKRERAALRAMTSRRHAWKPVALLSGELNRQLVGWANYFGLGYPRRAFRAINRYVGCRLAAHLRRRSQRPFRLAEGETSYRRLAQLGLIRL